MRPLDGIRIVDFTEGAQGPFAASLLADMGAEIVKIERPGGELMRYLGPFHGKTALPVLSICRGRYATVELDVKVKADMARVWDLIRNADMVIQNWKAGTDEKNGLSFEAVKAFHPTIVYIRSNGYGTLGPYGLMGSMDSLSQAISGMARLSGEADGSGERTRTPVLDFISAFVTAEAALIGLTMRRRKGKAVLVDSSQMSAALEAIAPEVELDHRDRLRPAGRRSNHSPCGGFFPCLDGQFIGFECEDEGELDRLSSLLEIPMDAISADAVEAVLLSVTSSEAVAKLASIGICARVVERRFGVNLFDDFPGAVGVTHDEVAGAVRHSEAPWFLERTPPQAGRPLGPVARDNPLLDALIDNWSRATGEVASAIRTNVDALPEEIRR